MREIAIIGGGASGIAAAIQAANAGACVTLLEAAPRIGRSILASGNGRCNWSNSHVQAQDYRNGAFVAQAFQSCPPQRVREWFGGLGLLWSEEGQGRLYPQANKASSVLDVLRFALDERGVQVECGRAVTRLAHERGGWTVGFAQGAPLRCDAVVFSCGGGFAERLLPQPCRIQPWESRLCALRTNREPLKGLDNVRVRDIRLSLHPTAGHAGSDAAVAPAAKGRVVSDAPALAGPKAAERGEAQFRDYGVSGIVAFNLSRFADPGRDALCIDFFPDLSGKQLREELADRMGRYPERTLEQLAAGMLLPAIARALLRAAGIDPAQRTRAFAEQQPEAAAMLARALKWLVLDVRGFEPKNAQVNRGGVSVEDVDPATMALRGHLGLHVTGEALDVDGPCGGYNLHWAWTSGILAGAAAAAPAFVEGGPA